MIDIRNRWMSSTNPSVREILEPQDSFIHLFHHSSSFSSFDEAILSISTRYQSDCVLRDFILSCQPMLSATPSNQSIDIRSTKCARITSPRSYIVFALRLAKLVHSSAIGRFFFPDEWHISYEVVALPASLPDALAHANAITSQVTCPLED